jgi:hypothetical protein
MLNKGGRPSPFIAETPIPKAKRSGIGKLNPDAVGTKRRIECPAACPGVRTRDLIRIRYER